MSTCKSCDFENPSDNAFCQNCGEPLGSGDTIGGLETPVYEPASAAPSPSQNAELEAGAVFAGRYTIIDKIGQGGMGTVYRASETLAGNERDIALKLIRADRLADQRAIDKLIHEGALTQDIRHPNVVNVYNVGVHEGQPFVAMELVKGVSLREWHRRQIGAGHDVPFDTAAAIVLELLGGLEAAHNLNIIHRDLKPENVMLTAEPSGVNVKLKILDFGIARAPGTIETGTGLGTPHYMAPEQITNPDTAGPPADFYSVFKIWYELLMDVLPQGHWQPPSSGRPDVEPLVDELIELGLSAKPSRRPQDVAQFRKWIGQAIPGFRNGENTPPLRPRTEPDVPVPSPSWGGVSPKVLGIGSAAVVGVVVLAIMASPEDYDSAPPYDEDIEFLEELEEDEEGDPEIGPLPPVETQAPLPPPPPPPVQRSVQFADLGGRWNVSEGGYFDVRINAAGNFEGNGVNLQGIPLIIRGNVAQGEYLVGNETGSAPGRISWDGACHLNFTTFNPDGSINYASQFHVDHAPGAPCPARFGG